MAAKQAFVTLVTNDDYAEGAVVLGFSLRESGTKRTLLCMVTKGVSDGARGRLRAHYHDLVEVETMDSNDADSLALLGRPELGLTFTKLFAWQLTDYEKCVFLDADTLVVANVDDLFEREELSAAADQGWPDCFNSGVFVFRPSHDTFHKLVQMASTEGSFDGGDQGLLNQFFGDWATADIKRHLPFTYNVAASQAYFFAPAYLRYKKDIKIVHFLGPDKPWKSQGGDEHFKKWWEFRNRSAAPRFTDTQQGALDLEAKTTIYGERYALEEAEARMYDPARRPSAGKVHVGGFAAIQAALDDKIKGTPMYGTPGPPAKPEKAASTSTSTSAPAPAPAKATAATKPAKK